MRSTGSTVSGVADHRSLSLPGPSKGPRPASFVHQKRTHSTGLDFDALAPACTLCGARSSLVGCDTGLCPACDPTASKPATPPAKVTAAPRATKPRAPRRQATRRTPAPKPAAQKQLPPDGAPRRSTSSLIPTGQIAMWVRQYAAGSTVPEIARQADRTPATIRRALRGAGVTLRDDRATKSGGQKKTYPATATDLERVARLYVEQRLSIDEVAARTNLTRKVVSTMLQRAGVPRRPAAHQGNSKPSGNTLAPLKARLAELGVTSADVKGWALTNGHLQTSGPGLPPARVIEAYAAAHTTGGEA